MVGESAQNFVHYYSIKPSTSIWCLTSLKTYGRLRCDEKKTKNQRRSDDDSSSDL